MYEKRWRVTKSKLRQNVAIHNSEEECTIAIIIREVAPLVEAAAVVMAVAADTMIEEIIMDVDVIPMTIQDGDTIQEVTIVSHMTDIETGKISIYDVTMTSSKIS